MGLLDRIFPTKYFADGRPMSKEEESQYWIATCPQCGHGNSIAALGGVRYRAQGSPKKLLPCLSCGNRSMMQVTWQPPTE